MKRPSLPLVICVLVLAVAIFWLVRRPSSDHTRSEPQVAVAGTPAGGLPSVLRNVSGSAAAPATQSTPVSTVAAVFPVTAPPSALPVPEPTAPGDEDRATHAGDPVYAPAIAELTVDGRNLRPRNFSGHFERVALSPDRPVSIVLAWPEDRASTEVFAQAIQGGSIDGAGNSKRLPLAGPDKRVAFTFTAPGSSRGLYEVLLRRGTVEEVLSFWLPTDSPQSDPPSLRP